MVTGLKNAAGYQCGEEWLNVRASLPDTILGGKEWDTTQLINTDMGEVLQGAVQKGSKNQAKGCSTLGREKGLSQFDYL